MKPQKKRKRMMRRMTVMRMTRGTKTLTTMISERWKKMTVEYEINLTPQNVRNHSLN